MDCNKLGDMYELYLPSPAMSANTVTSTGWLIESERPGSTVLAR